MLQDPEKIEYIVAHYPLYRDYVYHPEIDGRLYFNVNVSREDAVQLKMKELFDRKGFEERIGEIGDVDYVKAEKEEAIGMFFSCCFGFTVGMIWDKKDWKQYQKMEMEREKKRDALERGQW